MDPVTVVSSNPSLMEPPHPNVILAMDCQCPHSCFVDQYEINLEIVSPMQIQQIDFEKKTVPLLRI